MIQLRDDPFPHVIATDFYNQEELFLIRRELQFLNSPRKMLPVGTHHSNPSLTMSRALCLELAYTMPEISDILHVTKKTLDPILVSTICNKWPAFLRLKLINKIITKVRYYYDGEGYQPHADIRHDFLTFTYFHTDPKKFEGGELYFPDHEYQLDCNDNTMILIPSWVTHAVKPVSIDEDHYWAGNGRYCISQFMDARNTSYE